MKKFFELFGKHSAQYVVLHARYRASRGKSATVSFGTERNPRRALELAQREVATAKAFATKRKLTASELSRIMKLFRNRPV